MQSPKRLKLSENKQLQSYEKIHPHYRNWIKSDFCGITQENLEYIILQTPLLELLGYGATISQTCRSFHLLVANTMPRKFFEDIRDLTYLREIVHPRERTVKLAEADNIELFCKLLPHDFNYSPVQRDLMSLVHLQAFPRTKVSYVMNYFGTVFRLVREAIRNNSVEVLHFIWNNLTDHDKSMIKIELEITSLLYEFGSPRCVQILGYANDLSQECLLLFGSIYSGNIKLFLEYAFDGNEIPSIETDNLRVYWKIFCVKLYYGEIEDVLPLVYTLDTVERVFLECVAVSLCWDHAIPVLEQIWDAILDTYAETMLQHAAKRKQSLVFKWLLKNCEIMRRTPLRLVTEIPSPRVLFLKYYVKYSSIPNEDIDSTNPQLWTKGGDDSVLDCLEENLCIPDKTMHLRNALAGDYPLKYFQHTLFESVRFESENVQYAFQFGRYDYVRWAYSNGFCGATSLFLEADNICVFSISCSPTYHSLHWLFKNNVKMTREMWQAALTATDPDLFSLILAYNNPEDYLSPELCRAVREIRRPEWILPVLPPMFSQKSAIPYLEQLFTPTFTHLFERVGYTVTLHQTCKRLAARIPPLVTWQIFHDFSTFDYLRTCVPHFYRRLGALKAGNVTLYNSISFLDVYPNPYVRSVGVFLKTRLRCWFDTETHLDLKGRISGDFKRCLKAAIASGILEEFDGLNSRESRDMIDSILSSKNSRMLERAHPLSLHFVLKKFCHFPIPRPLIFRICKRALVLEDIKLAKRALKTIQKFFDDSHVPVYTIAVSLLSGDVENAKALVREKYECFQETIRYDRNGYAVAILRELPEPLSMWGVQKAIKHCSVNVFKHILNQSRRNATRKRALHCAIQNSRYDIIKLLVPHFLEINLFMADRTTDILRREFDLGSVKCANILFQSGKVSIEWFLTPVVQSGQIHVAEWFLRNGGILSFDNFSDQDRVYMNQGNWSVSFLEKFPTIPQNILSVGLLRLVRLCKLDVVIWIFKRLDSIPEFNANRIYYSVICTGVVDESIRLKTLAWVFQNCSPRATEEMWMYGLFSRSPEKFLSLMLHHHQPEDLFSSHFSNQIRELATI